MFVTYSVRGVDHICRRHQEMKGQERKVLETVESPEVVLKGDYGEKLAARFYKTTPLTSKYLVVAYKELSEADGFVVTAYFARRVADWREILWKP